MIRKGNTTAIVQLAKDKSEKTRIRVEKTISEMALKEEKINFNSVAQKKCFKVMALQTKRYQNQSGDIKRDADK